MLNKFTTSFKNPVADMWCFLSVLQLALRAFMRNQQGDSSEEPVLAPGNGITPKHKVDESWNHGNTGDSSSASVTASTLQAVSQMPQPLQQSQPPALCRALHDFNPEERNLEDSKYCLSFLKVWLSNYWLDTAGKHSYFYGVQWCMCILDLLKYSQGFLLFN